MIRMILCLAALLLMSTPVDGAAPGVVETAPERFLQGWSGNKAAN